VPSVASASWRLFDNQPEVCHRSAVRPTGLLAVIVPNPAVIATFVALGLVDFVVLILLVRMILVLRREL
jgi:hypothetical protein